MRNYAEWIATTPDPAESSDTSVTLSTLIRSHGSIRRNGDRATLRPSSRISPMASDRCSIEAQRDAHRRADAMLQTLALLVSNLRLAEAARVVGEIHARLQEDLARRGGRLH